jgi:hypothetical protein
LINEGLKEVLALYLAKSAALGTFPTDAERALDLYDEAPPIWYPDRPPIMDERPCDQEENGARVWRLACRPDDQPGSSAGSWQSGCLSPKFGDSPFAWYLATH